MYSVSNCFENSGEYVEAPLLGTTQIFGKVLNPQPDITPMEAVRMAELFASVIIGLKENAALHFIEVYDLGRHFKEDMAE